MESDWRIHRNISWIRIDAGLWMVIDITNRVLKAKLILMVDIFVHFLTFHYYERLMTFITKDAIFEKKSKIRDISKIYILKEFK